jgi:hypothetical protein
MEAKELVLAIIDLNNRNPMNEKITLEESTEGNEKIISFLKGNLGIKICSICPNENERERRSWNKLLNDITNGVFERNKLLEVQSNRE